MPGLVQVTQLLVEVPRTEEEAAVQDMDYVFVSEKIIILKISEEEALKSLEAWSRVT